MATKNLPAITPKQAIKTITKQFPAEAEVLKIWNNILKGGFHDQKYHN